MKPMSRKQAVRVLADFASRFGENFEEDFSERLTPTTTDEQCATIAAKSDHEVDTVLEIRDLWRAIELLLPGSFPEEK